VEQEKRSAKPEHKNTAFIFLGEKVKHFLDGSKIL
jgi:hypothetical protein